MGETVHRAAREKDECGYVESGNRNREAESLFSERRKREQYRNHRPEHERRFAPRELLARIAAVSGLCDGRREHDCRDRERGGNPDKLHGRGVRKLFVVAQRGEGGGHDAGCDACRDEGIASWLYERRDGGGDAFPHVLSNKDERRQQQERGTRAATVQ